MILVADGGSTKTHWCAITKDFNSREFYSEGYNPYFVDGEYIQSSLMSCIPQDLLTENVQKIYFYGAGVHNPSKALILENAFKKVFTNADIFIEHDLLAACKALLSNESGFAAILGTGTNTCIYNGSEISEHIDSAAYILGDEGSGCYIGKKLLTDYLRNYLPLSLKEKFDLKYNLSSDEITNRIYTQPLANRFCAGFSEFVFENIDHPHMEKLVESAFEAFFSQLVSKYPGYQLYSFNAVGSVAYYFREILKKVAERFGMPMGTIVKSPIHNLVKYHKRLAFDTVLLK